jgi:hypothetical protein
MRLLVTLESGKTLEETMYLVRFKMAVLTALGLLAACTTTDQSPTLPSIQSPIAVVDITAEVTPPARNVRFCMAGARGAEAFYAEAVPQGIFDCAVVYYTPGSGNVLPYLKYNPKTPIILVIKTGKDHGDGYLKHVAEGVYDSELRELGNAIRDAGVKVYLRYANEFNGDWYKHGVYHPGNDPQDFVPAWNHVTRLLKETAGELIVGFDMNLNRASAGGRAQSDFPFYFTGIQSLDTVSVSTYNRCGLSPAHAEQKSFSEEFGPAYRAIEALYNGPINVAEVSTTDLCGTDKLTWFRDMLESIEYEFLKVDTVVFFFETVPTGAATNNRPVVWGLAPEDWKAFRELINNFRTRNGIPIPEPVKAIATFGASGMELGSVRYPWSASLTVTSSYLDSFNPDTNDETDNPFGERGVQGFLRLSQGVEFGVGGLTGQDTLGLHVYATGALSDNENRYWDNVASVGVRAPYCFGKPAFVEWGNTCFFVGAKHVRYFAHEPKRLDNGDEQVYFGGSVNWGGYWGGGTIAPNNN